MFKHLYDPNQKTYLTDKVIFQSKEHITNILSLIKEDIHITNGALAYVFEACLLGM